MVEYLKKIYSRAYSANKLILISLVCLSFNSCTAKDTDQGQLFLLFAHNTPQASNIYIVRPDDTDVSKIGEFSSASSYWLSPTGKHLAVLNEALQIIDLSSGESLLSLDDVGQTRFESISHSENVAWSLQGDKLVFLRNAKVDDGLEVVLLDLQNNTTRILSSTDTIHRAPAWSPNGNYIAWASLGNTCHQLLISCPSGEQHWNIIVAEASGHELHKIDLRSVMKDNQLQDIWQKSLCNLSWSSTGAYIAFENACDVFGPPLNKEVFVISVEETYFYQVTKFSNRNSVVSSLYSLHWHPFNNELFVAYTVAPFEPLPPEQNYQQGVVVFIMEGKSFSEIIEFVALNHTAVWSPTGHQVLWHHIGNPNTLFLSQTVNMEIINEIPVHLAKTLCFLDFETKQWSPDGQYIATVVGKETSNNDLTTCDSRNGTSIAMLLNDGTVQLIGEEFQGQKQVLGWLAITP